MLLAKWLRSDANQDKRGHYEAEARSPGPQLCCLHPRYVDLLFSGPRISLLLDLAAENERLSGVEVIIAGITSVWKYGSTNSWLGRRR